MNTQKLICEVILLGCAGLIMATESPFSHQPFVERLSGYLSDRDLGRLRQADRFTHRHAAQEFEKRKLRHMWKNAITLELGADEAIYNHSSELELKILILSAIDKCVSENHGRWIRLSLVGCRLGEHGSAFLENLMREIVSKVHSLNIDLASINLAFNELVELPPHVFDGLAYLQDVRLNANKLTSLPSHIFDGLVDLEIVTLFSNRLTSLPHNIFEGLVNLKYVDLSRNNFPDYYKHSLILPADTVVRW